MKIYSILAVVLLMAFLSSSCTPKAETVEPSPIVSNNPTPTSLNGMTQSVTPSSTASQGKISFYQTQITPASATFGARTDLADSTILLSQLYRNDGEEKPETWWPTSQEFKVMNGTLTIRVELGKNGAPTGLSTGPSYHLEVWGKDNPKIRADYYFDLNGPPSIDIEFKGYPDRASYFPGQIINTTLSFINISPVPFKMSPFPPEISIRPRWSGEAVRHFAPDNGEVELKAGESVNYELSWDQRDDNGEPVTPGLYVMDVRATIIKETTPSTTTLGAPVASILIEYPQGAMEKSIDINQSQTVNGVTITLRRIEMTKTGMSVNALVNSIRDIIPTPLPDVSPNFSASAEYSVDGVMKDGGPAECRPEGNGIKLVWGEEGTLRDPVASDAKELTFTIMKVNNIIGPWKFRVPLQ